MLYCDARVAQQRTVNAASLFVDNNCGWLAPGLDTAIHADSPFNQLKAALNHDSHVVDEGRNAAVFLTSRGLRYLIANPSKLADFIQSEFVLTNGTRISEGHAKSLVVDVCALLRTCAVA